MATYRGIPFNGGMDSPTGTGAQHIVETIKAIIDFLEGCITPGILADAAGNPVLAWKDRLANNNAGVKTLDWENAGLYSYIDASLTVDWANRHLVDDSSVNALDWQNRTAVDAGGNNSVEWHGRNLDDSSGTQVSIAWEARVMWDAGGEQSIDWQNRGLIDNTGEKVMGWSGGIGFFSAPETVQQSGGAETADVTYGSTEQFMLQTAYDCLRTFGLLS
jgi:hypothetical protein